MRVPHQGYAAREPGERRPQPGVRRDAAWLPGRVPLVWDPHPRGALPLQATRLATPSEREARRFFALQSAPQRSQLRRRQRRSRARSRAAGSLVPAAPAPQRRRAPPVPEGSAVAVHPRRPRGRAYRSGDDTPFLAPAPVPAAGTRAGAWPEEGASGAGEAFAAAAGQVLRARGLLTEAFRGRAPGLGVHRPEAVPRPPPAWLSRRSRSFLPGPSAGRPDPHGTRWRASGAAAAVSWPHGGCFDLLHAGHVRLLGQARRLGDCLGGVPNSSRSVRWKGPRRRPLVGAPDRARVLGHGAIRGAVLIFDEPNAGGGAGTAASRSVWVKGSNYTSGELPEASVVRRYGGEVILLPYTDQAFHQPARGRSPHALRRRRTGGTVMRSRMRRAVVTGGAGFPRLTPVRALLAPGPWSSPGQLLYRLTRERRPLAGHPASALRLRRHRAAEVAAPATWSCTSRQPPSPSIICGCRWRPWTPAPGHPERPGPRPPQGARFVLASTSRGVRRPPAASAERTLLGQCEPRRPAQRLRRGQALRRGADHRLRPSRGMDTGIVRIFNTYGPRMRRTTGGPCPPSLGRRWRQPLTVGDGRRPAGSPTSTTASRHPRDGRSDCSGR